MAESAETLDT